MAEAKKEVPNPVEFSYTERDVILYNLGIGASEKELQWTYEGHDKFSALPTFGVIPQFPASGGIPLDWLPKFNPVRVCDRRYICILTEYIYYNPDRRSYCMANNTLQSKDSSLPPALWSIKLGLTRIVAEEILLLIPSVSRILEVLDKGKAAACTSIVETVDQSTGEVIFENQSTVFIRGSGGFGGKKTGKGMR